MRCSRVAAVLSPRRARSALVRRASTYYDSQSGLHVTRIDGIKVHDHSLDSTLLPRALAACLPSVALGADSVDSQVLAACRAGGVSPFLHAGQDATGWRSHLNTCAALGIGLSLELSCGATTELDVRLASDRQVAHAVELSEAAAEYAVPLRVGLLDVLAPGPARVELLACKLADAGTDVLTLVCPPGVTELADEIEELIECLVGSDVLGTPMSDRVGLRTMCGDEGLAVCERALELGVKHFDTSLHGSAAGPPHPAALARLLDRQGHAHSLALGEL